MSTAFATTPEQRAAELERLAEFTVEQQHQAERVLELLDVELRRESTRYLWAIAYADEQSATRSSTVQHSHDVDGHRTQVARILTRCTDRLARAGIVP